MNGKDFGWRMSRRAPERKSRDAGTEDRHGRGPNGWERRRQGEELIGQHAIRLRTTRLFWT